jgi:hypothetical protein
MPTAKRMKSRGVIVDEERGGGVVLGFRTSIRHGVLQFWGFNAVTIVRHYELDGIVWRWRELSIMKGGTRKEVFASQNSRSLHPIERRAWIKRKSNQKC